MIKFFGAAVFQSKNIEPANKKLIAKKQEQVFKMPFPPFIRPGQELSGRKQQKIIHDNVQADQNIYVNRGHKQFPPVLFIVAQGEKSFLSIRVERGLCSLSNIFIVQAKANG